MEPWTQHGLADSSWEKGEGSRERKKNAGKENKKKKLCGIHNSSLEMNVFVFSFAFNFALKLTSRKICMHTQVRYLFQFTDES